MSDRIEPLLHLSAVILWRCPNCGGTDPDSGQRARFCGRTKACTSRSRSGAIVTSTKMERVSYVPLPALAEIAKSMYEGMEIGSPEQLAVSEFLGRAESL